MGLLTSRPVSLLLKTFQWLLSTHRLTSERFLHSNPEKVKRRLNTFLPSSSLTRGYRDHGMTPAQGSKASEKMSARNSRNPSSAGRERISPGTKAKTRRCYLTVSINPQDGHYCTTPEAKEQAKYEIPQKAISANPHHVDMSRTPQTRTAV